MYGSASDAAFGLWKTKQDSDAPAEPVNLTVWVYYNGDQLESFNQLVAEFNDTTGKGVRASSLTATARVQ